MKPAANGLAGSHDDSLLWRVNQEEFSRRLRDAACVAYIRRRHGALAAPVVAAMLRRPAGAEQLPFQVRLHSCLQTPSADIDSEAGFAAISTGQQPRRCSPPCYGNLKAQNSPPCRSVFTRSFCLRICTKVQAKGCAMLRRPAGAEQLPFQVCLHFF